MSITGLVVLGLKGREKIIMQYRSLSLSHDDVLFVFCIPLIDWCECVWMEIFASWLWLVVPLSPFKQKRCKKRVHLAVFFFSKSHTYHALNCPNIHVCISICVLVGKGSLASKGSPFSSPIDDDWLVVRPHFSCRQTKHCRGPSLSISSFCVGVCVWCRSDIGIDMNHGPSFNEGALCLSVCLWVCLQYTSLVSGEKNSSQMASVTLRKKERKKEREK